jgi:excisionase family DNA binding protein
MKADTNVTKQKKRTVEDDAPLFAGLAGFVIQQQEKPAVEKPRKAVVKKVSRKNDVVKAITTTSKKEVVSKPVKTSRQAKPSGIDADAILLSIREMCTLLKISRATLVRMDNAGKIPGRMKLGGSVRFHRATVVAWLESMISPANTPF